MKLKQACQTNSQDEGSSSMGTKEIMAKAWGSNHVSHRKKTSQGNGRGTFSINMNKHKKRSYKKYRGQGK